MQGGFGLRQCLSAVGVAVAIGVLAPSASAEHLRTSGAVYGGVADEQEARSYPCPKAPAGGWERTGPVVCLAKQAATWGLIIEDDRGCSYGNTGYRGSCVYDLDMGDHVRIWGGRGIPYTSFIVDWGHAPATEPEAGTAAGGEAPAGQPGQPPRPGIDEPGRAARPAPPAAPPVPAPATASGSPAVEVPAAASAGGGGRSQGIGAPSQEAPAAAPDSAVGTGPADPAIGGGGSFDSNDTGAEDDGPGMAIAAGAVLATLLAALAFRLVRSRPG